MIIVHLVNGPKDGMVFTAETCPDGLPPDFIEMIDPVIPEMDHEELMNDEPMQMSAYHSYYLLSGYNKPDGKVVVHTHVYYLFDKQEFVNP